MRLSEYLAASSGVIKALAVTASTRADQAAEWLIEAAKDGRPILICGNGGSAADAMHIAAELVGRFKQERSPIRALALSADPCVMTAWANDYDYASVFARQVTAHGEEGGVLVALSTSGRSLNVLCAIEAALAMGMRVVALTGDGGDIADMPGSICRLMVPSRDAALIQQAHMCLYHYLCGRVEAAM